MVPIKKPDGSIRLCLEFSRVSNVSDSDTYCMYLVDDMLDKVGEAAHLFKLD